MPGKVNPVIPEVTNMVAYRVIGNDLVVTLSAEAGQLQLNAFEPVIAAVIFESQTLFMNAARTLRVFCVEGITANPEVLQALRRVQHRDGHGAESGHRLRQGHRARRRGAGEWRRDHRAGAREAHPHRPADRRDPQSGGPHWSGTLTAREHDHYTHHRAVVETAGVFHGRRTHAFGNGERDARPDASRRQCRRPGGGQAERERQRERTPERGRARDRRHHRRRGGERRAGRLHQRPGRRRAAARRRAAGEEARAPAAASRSPTSARRT